MYNIYLGHADTSAPTPLDYIFSVDAIIIHPDYDPKTVTNDIALIRVEGIIDPEGTHCKVRCICDPEPVDQLDIEHCRALGWGITGPGTGASKQLLEVPLPILEDAVCAGFYQSYSQQPLVCAGNVTGQNVCSGDSGGPLVCPVKDLPDTYSLAGIASFVLHGCGEGSKPGYFTRVHHYLDWIEVQTGEKSG